MLWQNELARLIGASRCHELVALAQKRSGGNLNTPAKRLLVSTSLVVSPRFSDELTAVCDFLLPHGNRAHHPDSIRLFEPQRTSVTQLRGLRTGGSHDQASNDYWGSWL